MKIKKLCLIIVLLEIGFLVYSFFLGKAFYINLTESAPRGVYLSIPYLQLHTEDFVVVTCPVSPEVKLSEDSLLLKSIAGLQGDCCIVKEQGIFINDRFYRKQQVGVKYKSELSRGKHCLPKGKILLLNEYPFSFDSRYFGYVEEKNIKNKVVLILSLEGL